jgi:hypothetical protein
VYDGKGKLTLCNQCVILGYFKQGYLDGSAKLVFENGDEMICKYQKN